MIHLSVEADDHISPLGMRGCGFRQHFKKHVFLWSGEHWESLTEPPFPTIKTKPIPANENSNAWYLSSVLAKCSKQVRHTRQNVIWISVAVNLFSTHDLLTHRAGCKHFVAWEWAADQYCSPSPKFCFVLVHLRAFLTKKTQSRKPRGIFSTVRNLCDSGAGPRHFVVWGRKAVEVPFLLNSQRYGTQS